MLYREATAGDVEELAAIRALDWGDQAYWVRRIGGYMRGESNPRGREVPFASPHAPLAEAGLPAGRGRATIAA